jgi:hypothetical protein
VSWQDDPKLQKDLRARSVRGKILRSAIIWGPLFLLTLAGTVFYTADILFMDRQYGATWVLVTIVGILAVLFGFQAVQSALDLFDKPRTESGYVTRRWARSDSLVVRSHYMRLEGKILRGDAYLLAEIKEGDYVEATFYPHSAVLVWVDKRPERSTDEAQPGRAAPPRGDGPIQRNR